MLKSLIKTTAAGLLYHTGVLDRIPRPALTVLGYHRVLEGPLEAITSSPLGMVVTPRMFERQLAYAARRYKMVTLEEIQDACEGRCPLPARACFVTFDDGWSDNYTVAYPILRRMGIPAAVFVTTDYMGTQKTFWFTTLMQSLLPGTSRQIRVGDGRAAGCPADVAGELDRLASLSQPLRAGQLDPLIELMKQYPEASIEKMVDALSARLDGKGTMSEPERFFLTWDELREMDRNGIAIGSHTRSHRILTQLTDAEAAEELRGSRRKLESELGHAVVSLAFPNGDYSPNHMNIAWDAGYRIFFVSTRVHRGGPAGRVFPRPCVHERVGQETGGDFSPGLLELHLSGFLDRLRGRAAT